jgi:transposase
MIFNTSRKYRIYPNQEQIQIIERTFGACRYVWNKMVESINYQYENKLPFTIPNYGDIAVNTDWLLDKSVKLDRHSVSNVKTFFKQSFIQCMKRFKEKKEFI